MADNKGKLALHYAYRKRQSVGMESRFRVLLYNVHNFVISLSWQFEFRVLVHFFKEIPAWGNAFRMWKTFVHTRGETHISTYFRVCEFPQTFAPSDNVLTRDLIMAPVKSAVTKIPNKKRHAHHVCYSQALSQFAWFGIWETG